MNDSRLHIDTNITEGGLLDRLSQARRFAPLIVVVIAIISAGYIRFVLRTGVTLDYTDFFLPWYNELAEEGLSAFSGNFANYNFPYLFLLYLTTFLPVTSLSAVKLIAIVGDVLLAFSVYRLASSIRPAGWSKWIATVAVAMVPSVFVVSAYWGQVDSLYCSFLFFALTAVIRRRYNLMWLWWGVALAFKLQAIFLLPFILIVMLAKNFRWYQPLIAIGSFVALSIPPVFFGRSLAETFSIYVGQTAGQWETSYWSASAYEWVPDSLAPFVGAAGTVFAFVVILAAAVLIAVRARLNDESLLYLGFLSMAVVPLLLPYMHDRYFFGATALSVVMAILKPDLTWVAVILQAVSLWSYAPFLAGQEPVALVLAPALVVVVVLVVANRIPGVSIWRRSTSDAPL